LKSANTLLNDSASKCISVLSEHKVLEDKCLVLESQIAPLIDEKSLLNHKVNTLSQQLSDCSAKISKSSHLTTEVNKLKNVNDVLKKTARKFEVLYKENSDKLNTCLFEKEELVKEMNCMEVSMLNDFNAISYKYMVLKDCIGSGKDPPPDVLSLL